MPIHPDCAVDRVFHALQSRNDQQTVQIEFPAGLHADRISHNEPDALVPELGEHRAAVGLAVDRTHFTAVIHDLAKGARSLRNGRKSHDGKGFPHLLGQTDRAQDIIYRRRYVIYRDVHILPQQLPCPAAGDDRVNMPVLPLPYGCQRFLQVAHAHGQLHIVSLRGQVRHQVVQALIGGDPEQPDLSHDRSSVP